MIEKFREVLFPGYFSREKVDSANLIYHMGQSISQLYDILSEQIIHVLRHDCHRYDLACTECEPRGHEAALTLIKAIPDLRRELAGDVNGAYAGDPAAKSHDEVIFPIPACMPPWCTGLLTGSTNLIFPSCRESCPSRPIV